MDDQERPAFGRSGREPRTAGSPADEDLRATTESIRSDGQELSDVEDEKLALDPADPRVDALSARAVELAERIVVKTRAEQQLAEELG